MPGPKPIIALESLDKICKTCGQTYTKGKDTSSVQFSKSKYCSRKCAKEDTDRLREQPSDWRHVTRQRFRVKVRKLFLDECAMCGWKEASCDVAHIDSSVDYFDVNNVIMLCPNHHRMYDQGFISKDELIMARDNVTLQDWVSDAS